MFRAIKILGWTLGVLVVLLVGGAVALFFSENSQWVLVSWPVPQLSLSEPFGMRAVEVLLGAVAAGWVLAGLLLIAALVLFPLYLRRVRQYRSTLSRLEKELVALRNLPLRAPAPLEDIPDEPARGAPLPRDDVGDLLAEVDAPESGEVP